jgi:hypothetical protein
MTVSNWDPFTVISISKLLLEMLHDLTYLSVSPIEQIPKIIIRINTLSDYILEPSFRFNQVGLCFFELVATFGLCKLVWMDRYILPRSSLED